MGHSLRWKKRERYEGNREDMDLPLKYYHDYWVEGIYPGIVTIIYLREARW